LAHPAPQCGAQRTLSNPAQPPQQRYKRLLLRPRSP